MWSNSNHKLRFNGLMIPAISMAAYTTYKVVMASANMKRARP